MVPQIRIYKCQIDSCNYVAESTAMMREHIHESHYKEALKKHKQLGNTAKPFLPVYKPTKDNKDPVQESLIPLFYTIQDDEPKSPPLYQPNLETNPGEIKKNPTLKASNPQSKSVYKPTKDNRDSVKESSTPLVYTIQDYEPQSPLYLPNIETNPGDIKKNPTPRPTSVSDLDEISSIIYERELRPEVKDVDKSLYEEKASNPVSSEESGNYEDISYESSSELTVSEYEVEDVDAGKDNAISEVDDLAFANHTNKNYNKTGICHSILNSQSNIQEAAVTIRSCFDESNSVGIDSVKTTDSLLSNYKSNRSLQPGITSTDTFNPKIVTVESLSTTASTNHENKMYNKRPRNTLAEDEIFFKTMTPQLKMLSEKSKAEVKFEIHKMIHEALLKEND